MAAAAGEEAPRPRDRLPVPGPEAQASALKELRDTFKADYGPNGPRDPSGFAEKLLKLARNTKQISVRFILHREAARIAAAAGDVDLVLAALDQEISTFAVDGREERRLFLSTLGPTAKGKAPSRRLAEEHLALAWADIEQDDFARAAESTVQARKLAARAGSVMLGDVAAELSKDITEIAAERARILNDIPLAGTAGTDAKVNASVGRFLCALKGDWERGLPLLARGLEVALTPQAENDRAAPTAAADRAAVGDGWWDIAQGAQGLPRRRFEERACHWYRLALPELGGIGVSKLEARLLSHELSRPDWIPRDSVLVLSCDESTLIDDARGSLVRDLSDRSEAVDRKGAQLTRGKAGEGLLFDGRDDGLQCGSRARLLAGGAFTVAAWAQPESSNPGAAGYVVGQDDWPGGDARGFVLRFVGDGLISFTVGVKTASGARWQSVTGPKVRKGEWCHAVAVFEAESMRLYCNGKLAATAKPDGLIQKSPAELRVGCCDFDKARRFHGVIDEVVLVSRAVSNEEVKALFERGRKGRSLR